MSRTMPRPAPALWRRPRPARPLPFGGGGPAPPSRYPIGINATGMAYTGRTWDSPDLMATASDPRFDRIQATLAAPYAAGSGAMLLSGANPWTIDLASGVRGGATGTLCTAAGPVAFSAVVFGGSPWLYNLKIAAGRDVDYPAGTYLQDDRCAFANSSKSPADWPLAPEHITPDGRHTGYPAGLAPGQSATVQPTISPGWPTGRYIVTAAGTGTLRIDIARSGVGVQGHQSVVFIGGVASGPVVVPDGQRVGLVGLVASSPADPLHDVRIYPEAFAGDYAAHAADPRYFRVHPDLVASLRPFAMLRFMDLMQANGNAWTTDWASRPPGDGPRPGVNRPPYGYLAAMANQCGRDSWWCVPHAATDDYVRGLAVFLRDNVDPSLRVAVERSNEMWNFAPAFTQSYFLGFTAVANHNPHVVTALTYDPATGLCTATLPGHGLAAGATVAICNAADGAYNAESPIVGSTADTFTYRPATAPATSPATPTLHHRILALDVASPACRPVAAAQFDGRSTFGLTLAADLGLANQDIIQVAGAADDAFNGLWLIFNPPDGTHATCSFMAQYYDRPMPTIATPAPAPIAAAPGRQLRCWRVANKAGNTAAGMISTWGYAQRQYAERKAAIDRILLDAFAERGQEARLIPVLAWQMPWGPNWAGGGIVARHHMTLGPVPAGVEVAVACAPYFAAETTSVPTQMGTPVAVVALAYDPATGLCTAAAPGHGLAAGDPVQVANATPAEFCGIYPAVFVDPDHFAYTPRTAPATSPARAANTGIGGGNWPTGLFAVRRPTWCREVVAASVWGGVMACISPGHGWAAGQVIHVCGDSVPLAAAPDSPLHGRFVVLAADPDTFAVAIPPGPYAIPAAAHRMWAWDDAALAAYLDDLARLPVLGYMQWATAAARQYGVPLRCYEGGLDLGLYSGYPPLADMRRAVLYSARLADITGEFVRRLYDAHGVACWNHYAHIRPDAWGIKQSQHEPNPPRWDRLMAMCDGPPDYADSVAPPAAPATAARRWMPG